jgi:hypothetical protein
MIERNMSFSCICVIDFQFTSNSGCFLLIVEYRRLFDFSLPIWHRGYSLCPIGFSHKGFCSKTMVIVSYWLFTQRPLF